MKTFLIIVGALALLSSGFVLIDAKSAVHEILAGIFSLTGLMCLGMAKIIGSQKKTADQLALVVKGLSATVQSLQVSPAGSATTAGKPVPVPGKELYFVSDGERGVGPYDFEQLKALVEKGTITRDTYILKQGAQEWQRLDSVFQI